MGCTPSMLLEHKKGHRDSTGSQDQVLGGKAGAGGAAPAAPAPPEAPRAAPRASMDSDGFSVLGVPTKKDSYVSQMGNNFTTSLHIKRISDASCMSGERVTWAGGGNPGNPGNQEDQRRPASSACWQTCWGCSWTRRRSRVDSKPRKGSSGGSPSARIGHRKSSLALTPEDEPLDITNRNSSGAGLTGGIIIPHQEPFKVLTLLFPARDRLSEALAEGCLRAGLEPSGARAEDALDACAAGGPSLVLVDARQQRLDAENLCRALRNLKCTQFTVIVAVVKKSQYVKEDFCILPFLDAGFNRVVVETLSVSCWCREVSQLSRGLARPLAQAAACRPLLAALQRCRDVVHVTDEHCRIQYVNRAGERLLGWRCLEAQGRVLGELGAEAQAQLARGREWEGALPARRRAPNDTLALACRATPTSCTSRGTTHYVFVSDPLPGGASSLSGAPLPAWEAPRGSLHSIRRASLDVRSIGSDGARRASLAKLPLEAPITKVIALLSSAQVGANPQTVDLIDRAVDVLRSTELYSPHMRENQNLRTDEPTANDLIGALLSREQVNPFMGPSNVLSSRRSSNDSTVIRSQTNRQQNIKHKAPTQIRELLDTSLSWDFDIFRLEELSKRRPLVNLGFNLMCHFDACDVLKVEERTLYNWLTVIEMNYHASNTYHNSTHAADVMQAVACYMQKDRLQLMLEPLDAVAALVAAAAHDVDHPGTSSAFLCNSRHPLAVLYNDLAVLESHHAALTFKLTLNDDRVNIFKNLDRDSYKQARHNVIDMILATEMTKHFEHLAKFVNVFSSKPGSKEDGIEIDELPMLDMNYLTLPENVVLVKRMMIKCADVSNPSRNINYCIKWACRIAEEYFLQTDEEKARELPVVMPVFDRASCSIPRSQIGFIDFIIVHMMEAWNDFIDMPELVAHTRANYQYWRDMDDQDVKTLQEIKKMQASHPMSQNTARASPE